MPIYAYRCSTCGHAQDVLQKLSDPLLTTCPACGEATYAKQLTAAGFQLKGSGWYVTDFRGDNTGKKADKAEGDGAAATADAKADAAGQTKADTKPVEGATAAASASTPKAELKAATAPAASPAAAAPPPAASS